MSFSFESTGGNATRQKQPEQGKKPHIDPHLEEQVAASKHKFEQLWQKHVGSKHHADLADFWTIHSTGYGYENLPPMLQVMLKRVFYSAIMLYMRFFDQQAFLTYQMGQDEAAEIIESSHNKWMDEILQSLLETASAFGSQGEQVAEIIKQAAEKAGKKIQ